MTRKQMALKIISTQADTVAFDASTESNVINLAKEKEALYQFLLSKASAKQFKFLTTDWLKDTIETELLRAAKKWGVKVEEEVKPEDPIPCWNCSHLGACEHYGKKCGDFEKFDYSNLEWSIYRVAKECGVDVNTIYYWFRTGGDARALDMIKRKLGINFEVLRIQKAKRCRMVLIKK